MKKIFTLAIIASFLFSCSSGNDEDAIKGKISDYQNQVADLNKKIKDLESQLPEGSNTNTVTGNTTKVRAMKVFIQPFSKYFTATGELEAINEAFISPEASGQITKISVVEGQRVKKGQLLAKLNTSIIEKNMAEVETQLNLAKTLFDKQTELWNKGIGSERQYLEAKNNYENLQNRKATLQEQYNMSIIRSPIDGYVEEIMLKQGELASPGMQLMQIVDLDNLYVAAKLSETYLPVVKNGDMVTISFPSFPDLTMEAPISRIGNVVNKSNRTFRLEIKIKNDKSTLKPNLLANVRINDYNSDGSIVVPSMVIREDMVGSYLYIVEENGTTLVSRKRYVETGRAYMDRTEIISGLSTDDIIITDGYGNVSDGAFIQVEG